MSTEKQINANRLNAQKSTGPTSFAGREKVSRNATRHGLLARTIVLDRENEERFTLLLATLHEEFEPNTTVEYDLVENMAIARWRLMRLWGIEKSDFDGQMRKQEEALLSNSSETTDPPAYNAPEQAALAFRTLTEETRSLDVMARYEARFERLYARSLDRLVKLREKRFFAKQSQFCPDADEDQ